MSSTRHLIRSAIAVTMALAAAAAAAAGAVLPTIVYPTGIYPDDVTRVQAALGRGGTIFLKSVNTKGVPTSFNFGTTIAQSGGVVIDKDVNIVGEVTRTHRTTILGGFLPVQGTVPVKTTIQAIDFESPFWNAITISGSTGSAIIDNVFHNIQPVRVRVPSGNIITFAQAIGFSGYDVSGAPAPGLITGNVLIAGNTIDGARAIFSNGIQLDSFSADTEITGNKISNVNDDTTETGSGIVVIRAQANVSILGNTISPGPTTNFGADGIFIGGDRDARYLVLANAIECQGPFSDGIDITGGDPTGTTGTFSATVIANSLVVNGDNAAGIVLWDLVAQNLVAANVIRGSGVLALGISTYGFDIGTASQNHLLANDIRGFSSNLADLFYDTNTQGNVEAGFCRSVMDLGSGNSSTCAAKIASSAQPPAVPNAVGMAAVQRAALSAKQQHTPQSFGHLAISAGMLQP